jgi:hypothetical protein
MAALDTIAQIIWEIITSTIYTFARIAGLLLQLFRELAVGPTASPLTIFIALGLLALVIYGLFKFAKGESKTIIIAIGLLILLLLVMTAAVIFV